MPQIRIRIGAALDPGASRVLEPLLAAVGRARTKLAKAGSDAGDDFVGGYRTSARKASKVNDDITADVEKALAKQAKAREKDLRDQERAAAYVVEMKRRYFEQEEKAEQRIQKRRVEAAKRVGSKVVADLKQTAMTWVGRAGAVASGAGVDLDIGSNVRKVVEGQKRAVAISSSGYVEGEAGAAGKRQDPKAIYEEAQKAANKAALDTDQVLTALHLFTGKTTDLETGRKILGEMAVLSKATSSNMEDVMGTAGDISNKLGDMPDKAEVLSGLMRTMAIQGKLGASELAVMARVLPTVVGPANKFAGGGKQSAAELGTLFQVTKRFGGVKSPDQAATSVASFVADLTSKSGLKALSKMFGGEDKAKAALYSDKGHLKALHDIMPALLEVTGGDLTKIAKTMPNKRSKSVLDAFTQLYGEAEAKGGAGAGKKEIGKVFSQYGGEMSKKEIADSLAASLETTDSKVQMFNNRMEDLAAKTLPKLVPAFERLAPIVERLANMLADKATFIAENPKTAIAAAIGISVMKASIPELIKEGIKSGFGGNMGAIFGSALAGAAVTIAITDAVINLKEKAQEGTRVAGVNAINAAETLRTAREKGTISPEDLAKQELLAAQMKERVETASKPKSFWDIQTGGISGIASYITAGSVGTSFSAQAGREADRANLEQLKADNKMLVDQMAKVHAAIASGVLKVQVVNQPGTGMGGPAGGATTGPSGVR